VRRHWGASGAARVRSRDADVGQDRDYGPGDNTKSYDVGELQQEEAGTTARKLRLKWMRGGVED